MGIYVVTGASSGIGLAIKEKLISNGNEVCNVDYKNGDITADLSKKEDRQRAVQEIYKMYPEGIDGLVCNAGVGPTFPATQIFSVNFFAPVELSTALKPLLMKKQGACVFTASNTITLDIVIRNDWVDLMVNSLDEEKVIEFATTIPQQMGSMCYSSSKKALVKWIRRNSAAWAYDKVRINAVAPGNTTTAMTAGMTEQQWHSALLIPIPTRYGKKEFLDASEIANGMYFLLSKEASGVNGTTLYVDGGIDALLRTDEF